MDVASERELELWNTLTGAELIRAIGDGRFPQLTPVSDHLRQTIVTAEPGRVELSWTPVEELCNPGGTVHGGYIAMILDNAVCLAGSSLGEHFMPMLTLNLNIEYLRAVQAGTTYSVVGTTVHAGKTRIVGNALVMGPDGRAAAQATGSITPNQAFARR